MMTLALEEVQAVRARFAQARAIAAARFRESFAQQTDLPPNERWRAHLEIQAASMLEVLEGVFLPPELRIVYVIADRVIRPVAFPRAALFPYFRIERTVTALFEHWIFTSELMASAAWQMTRVIATADEYNAALAGMKQPQLIKPLFVSYLPAGEFREDGTALLEVTVYTRADEERIERRELLLDRNQEFHFHGRDLIAEGRGGVAVTA